MNYLGQGNLIVSNFSDDSISIVDTTMGREAKRISLNRIGQFFPNHQLGPHHIALDPNLKFLYVANSHDNSITKMDLITEEIVDTVLVGSCPSQVILCRKYNYIYVANSDSNSITVLDLNSFSTLLQVPTDEMPHGMIMTKDQERILIANRDAKTMTEISTKTNQKEKTYSLKCKPWHLKLSGDGNLLFVVNYNYHHNKKGIIKIYDIHQMKLLDQINIGKMPVEVVSDWRNETLYVTDSDLNQLYVYSLRDKRLLRTLRVNEMPHGIEIDHHKRLIYISSVQKNVIDVVNCRNNTLLKSIAVGKEPTSIIVI